MPKPKRKADELPCASCGVNEPARDDRGRLVRRFVPQRSRSLPVCSSCAKNLDDQLHLEARAVLAVDRAVDRQHALVSGAVAPPDFEAMVPPHAQRP